MYEFIYDTPDPGKEEIRVSSFSDGMSIYEVGELFSRFLLAVGFQESSIRDLFGLEEGEELPVHVGH